MTKRDISLLKSFAIFVFLIAVGVVVTVRFQERTGAPAEASTGDQKETSVNSSNADKKLILRTTPKSGGMTEYSYIVADVSGKNQRVVFDKTVPAGTVMTLPYNSWDPTDTYIFIEEKVGSVPDYYVMKSTGGSLIDVGAVWNEKKIPYTIREATGWASDTLLIIYTSASDGSKGPAFWFEIPSTAILQLAG
jgi:hypothetical protein